MNMEKRFPRTQESSIHAEDIRLDNICILFDVILFNSELEKGWTFLLQ